MPSEIEQQKNIESTYETLDFLGKGAYASVYRAINRKTGEICAIKKLSIQAVECFDVITEIKILKSCKSEHVVKLIDIFNNRVSMQIVMEYCAGGSLKDVMNTLNRKFSEEHISIITRDVLNGLNHLHSEDIIHRDIKCANILLTEDGVAKLADFGVSQHMYHSLPPKLTGTYLWIPPEVLRLFDGGSDPPTPLIDIWSLGISIIEMAEGSPPYADYEGYAALKQISDLSIPALTFKNPSLWSKSLNDFLKFCLVKDPSKRKTADELLQTDFIDNAKDRTILVDLVEEVCSSKLALGSETDLFQRSMLMSKENSILLELLHELQRGIKLVQSGPKVQRIYEKTIERVETIMSNFNAKHLDVKKELEILYNRHHEKNSQSRMINANIEEIKKEIEELNREKEDFKKTYESYK